MGQLIGGTYKSDFSGDEIDERLGVVPNLTEKEYIAENGQGGATPAGTVYWSALDGTLRLMASYGRGPVINLGKLITGHKFLADESISQSFAGTITEKIEPNGDYGEALYYHDAESYFLLKKLVSDINGQAYDTGYYYVLCKSTESISQYDTLRENQNYVLVNLCGELDHIAEDVVLHTSRIASLANDFAPAFSSSSTYADGAYCTRYGVLYRCTTAITTPEDWTAAHWTAVSVGGDIVSYLPTLFAPAGYGLGGIARQIATTDNVDALTAGGFFYCPSSTAASVSGTTPFGSSTGFGLLVMPMGTTTASAAQIALKYPGSASDTEEIKYRVIRNGTARSWFTIALA